MCGLRNTLQRLIQRVEETTKKAFLISYACFFCQISVILIPRFIFHVSFSLEIFLFILFVQTISGLLGARLIMMPLGAVLSLLVFVLGEAGITETVACILFTVLIFSYRLSGERKTSGKNEELLDSLVQMRSFQDMTERIMGVQQRISEQEKCANQGMNFIRQAIAVFAQKSDELFFNSLALSPKVAATNVQLKELIKASLIIQDHLNGQEKLISDDLSIREEMVSVLNNLTEIVGLARSINESMSRNVTEGAGNISNAFVAIKQLEMKQKQSREIIDIISGISDQINVLAINTAVQAARAGKYGSGFGVVSKEIRNLADATSMHAVEISKLIHDMNDSISASILSISSAEIHLDGILNGVNDSVPIMDKITSTMSEVMRKDQIMILNGRELLKSASVIRENAFRENAIVTEYRETFSQLNIYLESLSLTIDTLRDQNERAVVSIDTLDSIQDETCSLNGTIQGILQKQVR